MGAGDDDEVHKQGIISRARHENGSGSDPSSLIDRQTDRLPAGADTHPA